jgi:uncharacterized protein GlcG (DUF336 family)
MATISLDIAKKIADAAFVEGKARNLINMSVVVVDQGANIRVANRADGQGQFGVDLALGKARTALGFSRSSLELAKYFGQYPATTTGITAVTGGKFIPLGGGVVVTNEEGEILGGAGVAGGAPETDHATIVAAVESVGLKVLP